MAKGEFELAEPMVVWTIEEWERASRYSFINWWNREDELFLARCIELPEAISHGDTPEEAIHNAIDAVASYFDASGISVTPIENLAGELAFLFYTTDQVAEILGVNTQRVQALTKSRGTGTKRGRDLLFTAQDIDAMRDRRVGRPAIKGQAATG